MPACPAAGRPPCRLPFAQLQGLETGAGRSFTAAAHRVVRMRPNAADVPYAVDRDAVSIWTFELDYAGLEEFMPLAQQMLLASRLPPAEQEEMLEVRGAGGGRNRGRGAVGQGGEGQWCRSGQGVGAVSA